ncbi:MAG TPA: hypothetical protein VN240_01100 [Propylenella sp.]|nr:hypothetical protein [Propylenella sp.]
MGRFTPTFLYLTGGLTIWGVRFLAIYSFMGLACARGWAAPLGGFGAIQLVALVVSLAALAACLALIFRAASHVRARTANGVEENIRFIHYVAGSAAALAGLAIVLESLPFFLIPICT